MFCARYDQMYFFSFSNCEENKLSNSPPEKLILVMSLLLANCEMNYQLLFFSCIFFLGVKKVLISITPNVHS